MNNWILVKVDNYYMIRLKDKRRGEWIFFGGVCIPIDQALRYAYMTRFKGLAKRKLNQLINKEQEDFVNQKKLKVGGDVL